MLQTGGFARRAARWWAVGAVRKSFRWNAIARSPGRGESSDAHTRSRALSHAPVNAPCRELSPATLP